MKALNDVENQLANYMAIENAADDLDRASVQMVDRLWSTQAGDIYDVLQTLGKRHSRARDVCRAFGNAIEDAAAILAEFGAD